MSVTAWTATEWTAFGDLLSGAGTVIGALAVIVAAYLGSSTFKSWRHQTLSQRRIEQAERMLTATYRVRRGLPQVRNPMLWGHERQKAEDYLKERGELPNDQIGSRKMTTAQAYFNRLNAVLDDRKELEACQPMARALFGEELELAMETLNQQFQRVSAAVDAQFHFSEDTDRNFRAEIEATLWGGTPNPEENKMDREIREQVATIKRHCVPVLRLEKAG